MTCVISQSLSSWPLLWERGPFPLGLTPLIASWEPPPFTFVRISFLHQFPIDIFLHWDADPLTMKTFLYNSHLGKKMTWKTSSCHLFIYAPLQQNSWKFPSWHLFLMMSHHHSSTYSGLAFFHWNRACQGLKNVHVAKFCRRFPILILLYTQGHPV